jgi:hypothetical protein
MVKINKNKINDLLLIKLLILLLIYNIKKKRIII